MNYESVLCEYESVLCENTRKRVYEIAIIDFEQHKKWTLAVDYYSLAYPSWRSSSDPSSRSLVALEFTSHGLEFAFLKLTPGILAVDEHSCRQWVQRPQSRCS